MTISEMRSPQDAEGVLLRALGRRLIDEDAQNIQLSQHLHKDIAGGLVACTSLSEMIRHELSRSKNGADVTDMHARLDAALRQTLGVMRDMTEQLFPPALKVFGLNAALQQLVRGLTEDFAGSLVLHIEGNEPVLSLPDRLNLYRIMEGILRLCTRGGSASWLEMKCQVRDGQIEVTIDHDGSHNFGTDGGSDTDLAVVEARCSMFASQLDISPAGTGRHSRISLRVTPPGSLS